MFDTQKVSIEWGGKTLTLETGKVARQADGAVIATLGETVVLCAVTAAKTVKINGNEVAIACEMSITIWVGLGSLPPPNSLNIFSKTGITWVSSTVTTMKAMQRTEMG